MREALERALGQGRWEEANEQTRQLLAAHPLPADTHAFLDRLWTRASQGRFGFSVQRRIWDDLGGPKLEGGPAVWEFFEEFGERVGWRRDGAWVCWASEDPSFPALDLANLSPGCLPFHDVLSSGDWLGEFSPRDCWGEGVWESWARLLSQFPP